MFGLTKSDIIISNNKLEKQREFLKSNGFLNSRGDFKSFFDCSMSANFSQKYYAEVSNRVNTISSLNACGDFIPVFLTITLNSCFRSSLVGDFSKFCVFDIRSLPVTQKRKMNANISFKIRDLTDILNYAWHKFCMSFYKRFKTHFSYIRVFEPHKKDGVPHVHALIYIPKHSLKFVIELYKKYFYAPQNLRTDKVTFNQYKNGEFNGFQWSLKNAVGYVMKYITKTFINLSETDKLNEINSWYVVNKVRRFLTSRTSIPLWVFRKINFLKTMRDFCNLNILRNCDDSVFHWDFNSKTIFIDIPYTREKVIFFSGQIKYFCNDILIKELTIKNKRILTCC